MSNKSIINCFTGGAIAAAAVVSVVIPEAYSSGTEFGACDTHAALNPDKIEEVRQNLSGQRDSGVKNPRYSFEVEGASGETYTCSYKPKPNPVEKPDFVDDIVLDIN